MVFLALLLAGGCSPPDDAPLASNKKVESPKKPAPEIAHLSPTTGLATPSDLSKHLSVIIENTKDARPQSGLSEADVVYEAYVEGKITRYLALFHDQIPYTVGPVRSARHYFIPLAHSWSTPIYHYGGSPLAYEQLKNYPFDSYDGTGSAYSLYYRDQERKAPHNAYLYSERTPSPQHQLQSVFSFDPTYFDQVGSQNETIALSYNPYTAISYRYSDSEKRYVRSLNGSPQTDRNNSLPIKTTNVIIMKAEHTPLESDGKGRITIHLDGEGEAYLFSQGKSIPARWKNSNGVLRFYTAQNRPIPLHPGNTWIQIIPSDMPFSLN